MQQGIIMWLENFNPDLHFAIIIRAILRKSKLLRVRKYLDNSHFLKNQGEPPSKRSH